MASSKSVVIAALIANAGIAITKFIGYLLSGSPSMLSETYHSISDTGNQILLLAGLNYSSSKSSEKHPFGKGKSQFFYSLLVSVFLFGIAGFQSAKHGYNALVATLTGQSHTETADIIIFNINFTEMVPVEVFWINIGVLILAFIFELYALNKAMSGIQRIQEEKGYNSIIETFYKTTDTTTLTAFTEDFVALLGIFIAFIGIVLTRIFNNPIYDASTSLLIGIILMIAAVALAWENKRLILGESMDKKDQQIIRDCIEEFDNVDTIIDIKTVFFGPDYVLAAIRLDVIDGLDSNDIEKLTEDIDKKIRSNLEQVKSVYIEPDKDNNSE